MDIFDKIKVNRGPLGQHAKGAHGYFFFPKLEGEIGPRMSFRGTECLTWSVNNYLGLANHPEVRKADADAAAEGIAKFRSFLTDIGVPVRLSELKIQASDLPEIVNGVVKVSFGADGNLNCNPPVSREDLMEVLTNAL